MGGMDNDRLNFSSFTLPTFDNESNRSGDKSVLSNENSMKLWLIFIYHFLIKILFCKSQ